MAVTQPFHAGDKVGRGWLAIPACVVPYFDSGTLAASGHQVTHAPLNIIGSFVVRNRGTTDLKLGVISASSKGVQGAQCFTLPGATELRLENVALKQVILRNDSGSSIDYSLFLGLIPVAVANLSDMTEANSFDGVESFGFKTAV